MDDPTLAAESAHARRKWDAAAERFDLMAGYGPEKRWEPFKRELFSAMNGGRILFLAIGTGLDIPFWPSGQTITGIDISPKMLEVAQARADAYDGQLELAVADVHDLEYPDGHFDQIFTSCTFCSVPNPIDGLRALKRVLKPGGELFMFEHTGSRWFPFSVMMNVMTQFSRRVGPDMNRKTDDNVRAAGFEVEKIDPVFLDVVKRIHARRPLTDAER